MINSQNSVNMNLLIKMNQDGNLEKKQLTFLCRERKNKDYKPKNLRYEKNISK